jgi:hypothetical protein
MEQQATKAPRMPVMVAGLAVLLVILHLGTVAAQRESLQASLAASDANTMVQSMSARETVLIAHANQGGLDADVRSDSLAQVQRLRQGSVAGQGMRSAGIDELEARVKQLRAQAEAAADRSGWLGLGETGVVLALLLLAFAQMLGGRMLVWLGGALALSGVLAAVAGVLLTA